MKKVVGIGIGILGVVLFVVGLVLKIKGNMSVSIIGGADGPTSIFLAGKVGGTYSVYSIIIGVILLAVAVFIFIKHKH